MLVTHICNWGLDACKNQAKATPVMSLGQWRESKSTGEQTTRIPSGESLEDPAKVGCVNFLGQTDGTENLQDPMGSIESQLDNTPAVRIFEHHQLCNLSCLLEYNDVADCDCSMSIEARQFS